MIFNLRVLSGLMQPSNWHEKLTGRISRHSDVQKRSQGVRTSPLPPPPGVPPPPPKRNTTSEVTADGLIKQESHNKHNFRALGIHLVGMSGYVAYQVTPTLGGGVERRVPLIS